MQNRVILFFLQFGTETGWLQAAETLVEDEDSACCCTWRHMRHGKMVVTGDGVGSIAGYLYLLFCTGILLKTILTICNTWLEVSAHYLAAAPGTNRVNLWQICVTKSGRSLFSPCRMSEPEKEESNVHSSVPQCVLWRWKGITLSVPERCRRRATENGTNRTLRWFNLINSVT